jgi:Kdo2-lipid IVA lauroyltransferase/acyltransferase
MPKRTALRNGIEYAAARALIATTKALPRAWVPGFSRGLGTILHGALKKRRQVVFDNVRLAYGDDPAAPDPVALSKASFASLCRSFLELFLLPPASRPEDLAATVSFKEGASWEDLRRRIGPGPVIYCASHTGAWEIAGAVCALRGEAITTLIRPFDNPLLDAYVNRIRMRFGQRLASNRGGLKELLAALDAGRSVAVLIDLNMRRKGAVFVDFFGTPAATARTTALLALRTGRPLVPVFTHRLEAPFRFEIEVGEPIFPDLAATDRAVEVHRLLQEATAAVERFVRRNPGEWLWTHRRWKTRPDGSQR